MTKKREKKGIAWGDGRKRKKAKERIDDARMSAKNVLNVNERVKKMRMPHLRNLTVKFTLSQPSVPRGHVFAVT